MQTRRILLTLSICLFSSLTLADTDAVKNADRALAKAVADRDESAFRELLEEGAIFLGGSVPLRGPDAIVDGWSVFFDEASGTTLEWEPTEAIVAQSGELAVTTGGFVYHDAEGASSKGNYLTVWRTDDGGRWRVVVDGTLRVRGGEELPAQLTAEEEIDSQSGDLHVELGNAGGQEGGFFAVYVDDGSTRVLFGASFVELPATDD